MKISCMHLKLTLREAAYPQRWKRWVILNCHIPLYTHFSLQMKWNVNLSLLLDTMNRWGAKPHFIPFSVRFILEEHLRETGGLLYFQVLIFRRVIGQKKKKMIVRWAVQTSLPAWCSEIICCFIWVKNINCH